MVEQRTENPSVGSSILPLATSSNVCDDRGWCLRGACALDRGPFVWGSFCDRPDAAAQLADCGGQLATCDFGEQVNDRSAG